MSRVRMIRVFAVIAVLAIASDQCFAQQQGRQRGGSRQFSGFGRTSTTSMDKTRLLAIEQVQTELGLNEEQVVSVKETLDGYSKEVRAIAQPRIDFSGYNELSDEEKAEKRKEREEAMAKVTKQRDKIKASTLLLIEASLEPKQVARLNQIEVQLKGVRGLTDEKIVKALGLSEEQVTKIKEIFASQDAKVRSLFSGGRGGGGDAGGRGRGGDSGGRGRGNGGGGNDRPQRPSTEDGNASVSTQSKIVFTAFQQQGGQRGQQRGGFDREAMQKRIEELQAKMKTHNEETEKLVIAVLTDDQKKKYEAMKGEKFELDTAALSRNRGGNRNGGGGNRNGGGGNRRGGGDGGGRPQRPSIDN